MVKDVKNYATFFAVGKNRVGYKTVVSFDDRYMIAILGFVRFDGLWFLTESHVGFLDYPSENVNSSFADDHVEGCRKPLGAPVFFLQ